MTSTSALCLGVPGMPDLETFLFGGEGDDQNRKRHRLWMSKEEIDIERMELYEKRQEKWFHMFHHLNALDRMTCQCIDVSMFEGNSICSEAFAIELSELWAGVYVRVTKHPHQRWTVRGAAAKSNVLRPWSIERCALDFRLCCARASLA